MGAAAIKLGNNQQMLETKGVLSGNTGRTKSFLNQTLDPPSMQKKGANNFFEKKNSTQRGGSSGLNQIDQSSYLGPTGPSSNHIVLSRGSN